MPTDVSQWRLGQLIENIFGCLGEKTDGFLPIEQSPGPHCIFNLSDSREIRRRLEIAYHVQQNRKSKPGED